jgi:hypothetical protein
MQKSGVSRLKTTWPAPLQSGDGCARPKPATRATSSCSPVREHRDSIPEGAGPGSRPAAGHHRRPACPAPFNLASAVGAVVIMARKDGASRRLAFEIAVAKRVKELCEEEGLDGPLGDFGLSTLGLPKIGIHPETLVLGNMSWWIEYEPWAKPTLDAFKAFDLDHRRISGWCLLLMHLARVLFPNERRSGRPRKWTDDRLRGLLADFAAYKHKHPKKPDTVICKWLEKRYSVSAPRLRRVLNDARRAVLSEADKVRSIGRKTSP